jgi:hypothetical protein
MAHNWQVHAQRDASIWMMRCAPGSRVQIDMCTSATAASKCTLSKVHTIALPRCAFSQHSQVNLQAVTMNSAGDTVRCPLAPTLLSPERVVTRYWARATADWTP